MRAGARRIKPAEVPRSGDRQRPRRSTYEVSIKELGFRPEPYVIGDALMYADGKPIVEITNISLRLRGLTRERLRRNLARRSRCRIVFPRSGPRVCHRQPVQSLRRSLPPVRSAIASSPDCPARRIRFSIALFACRMASRGSWRRRDGGCAVRRAARRLVLRRQSLRVRCPTACSMKSHCKRAAGWPRISGAALTSPEDLLFRNLGGNAIQHAAIRPDAGTLTTSIKLTERFSGRGRHDHPRLRVRR